MKEWTTPNSRNTPSTTNLEEEEIVDAPANDGNASMPEQVKRPNQWRKKKKKKKKMMMMMMMMMIMMITKCSSCFKFYLQMFTGVQCGFLVSRGRCPLYKRFRPKSYESCPHPWSQPLVVRDRSSSKLARRAGTKTFVFNAYPYRNVQGC